MPPKKDVKKGAPVGNYKAGKLMKDILAPNAKLPREGLPIKVEGEPEVQRSYDYEPYPVFPEWPGNEEAKNHDFTSGVQKDGDGNPLPFTDEFPISLPPSFKEYARSEIKWLRPDEYLREIAYKAEVAKRRNTKKEKVVRKRTMRKQSILAMSGAPSLEELSQLTQKRDIIQEEEDKKDPPIQRDDVEFEMLAMAFEERLETEEEVRKRKEELERIAAADKAAKKKPPPKGAPVSDPSDEPQMIKVPLVNTMDMGLLMPLYSKWVLSQIQFIKDRTIRDVDTKESIWQKIYPQENGMPVLSPNGKYWVKLRFQGKDRLIEVDDTIPCDGKKELMFPRTVNNFEIWPQILMKALCKVYSYKWYTPNAHYDSEVGDGSIVYSLTGLIPEHIPIKDFDGQGIELIRKILSDDHYFNKKTYATCYCSNDHKPKMPSQMTTLKKIDFGVSGGPAGPQLQVPTGGFNSVSNRSNNLSVDVHSEPSSALTVNSSQSRALGKMRDYASMAISVTTGKKLNINNKDRQAYVITGYGYALMDLFENDFVDMDSIVKKKDEIEEVKSPFISPKKRSKEKAVSKEEYKRRRREEKKRELEERERREKEPPKQYSIIKIKTSVGHYPVMNYLSPFSNDEIYEGKKCKLNGMRRPPEQERIESPTTAKYRDKDLKEFSLNVQMLDSQIPDKNQSQNIEQNQTNEDNKVEEEKELEEQLNLPKSRAPGGVWILSSDFPHSFQHLIVYHNPKKFNHTQVYNDVWEDVNVPYLVNDKEIVLKFEPDAESRQELAETVQNSKIHEPSGGDDVSHYEMLPVAEEHKDSILVAYAPNPTSKPDDNLPRYLMRLQQLDYDQDEEDQDPIDLTIKTYFEGRLVNIFNSQEKTIFLRPNVYAPQGLTLWLASQYRKIAILSKAEYLVQEKGYFQKQYQFEYLPQEKGKYHMFCKYEFQVAEEDTKVIFKVDLPADRYLLNFIRLKVIDKNSNLIQTQSQTTLNQVTTETLTFQPNDGKGYILMVEGIAPYNTVEGQFSLEVLSNKDSFGLDEVQHVEPLEYTDKFYPSKYGIIFKEKIYVGDHTSTAINIRLKKDDQEFNMVADHRKLFRFEVYDNGELIFVQEGYNQLTISHLLFRSNAGLPEQAENDGGEIKHNYVVQAVFDLYEWPKAKTNNSETANITWHMKIYTSDTLAIVKDTDKEDREKSLKVSWESNEPSRAEKAKKSRQKWLLQQKLKEGEELTEDELAIVNEVRVRVRQKDEPVEQLKGKPAGKAPPKGKEDPKAKGGKGAAAAQPIAEDLEEKNKRPLPEPSAHVNNSIRTFLNHFKSERLITMECVSKSFARKRDESEKALLLDEREQEKQQAQVMIEAENQRREDEKVFREDFKARVFGEIDNDRAAFKERLTGVMDDRNKYRDMIALRKEKEKNLLDMLQLEKIDFAAITKAIEEARENLVKEEVIQKAEKAYEWLSYCKGIEQQLQQATQEKSGENLRALFEKIDKEGIIVEPKVLTDAKNTLSKIK